MKKTILVSLLLLFARMAEAGELKGILAFHSSKYLLASEATALGYQHKWGTAVGAGYTFSVSRTLSLEADLLLGAKGAKTSLAYGSAGAIPGTYRCRFLALPILLAYRFKTGATPYAGLGPEFNFILSHRLSIPEYEESFDVGNETKKFIPAFNVALGYEIPLGRWRLFVEARYNRWLANLWKNADASVKCETLAILLGASRSR